MLRNIARAAEVSNASIALTSLPSAKAPLLTTPDLGKPL
jgi:hypothetical protein